MLQNAKNLLKKYVPSGSKIFVAVSGGEDSVALAHLVFSCGLFDKNNITLVHINHNLRGKNSDDDEAFVCAFAKQNNVEFITKSVDVAALCTLKGHSIESAARQLRYEAFDDIKNSVPAGMVLTAHHALDNVETILMNLFRGCGVNGLKGMEILTQNWLLRPFLTTTKDEIKSYTSANNLAFRVDETNSNNDFSRNYLRNQIMPLIQNKWGGVVQNILSLSSDVRNLTEQIDKQADSCITLFDDGVKIDLDALKADNSNNGIIIINALKKAGAYKDITRENINQIARLSNAQNGTAIDLDKGFRAIKEYDKIVIFSSSKNSQSIQTPFKIGEFEINNQKVKVSKIQNTEVEKILSSDYNYLKKVLVADSQKIPNSAVFRARCDGDIFTPFGGGTKKLKKFLIDKKIPVRLRDKIVVLADKNEVLAILGVEISDKIKAELNCSALIKMSVNY